MDNTLLVNLARTGDGAVSVAGPDLLRSDAARLQSGGGRRRCAVGVSVALAGVAGVSAALLGNRHVWFGGLDRLDESAQGRVSIPRSRKGEQMNRSGASRSRCWSRGHD